LWRRRTGGVAWFVAGVAGIALLGPALALPDGIPSQAGLLASQAPWRGVVSPQPANPQLLDVTHQVEPWLLFLRREVRAGRLPFWDPHQLSGEPFWSNGSSAPLFPLHLLFVALPVRLGLLLLPWLRLVVGGCGAAALARELGVAPRPALVAAVVYPLSGMTVSFLLFPMGNTHALVPWVLWAIERIAAGRGTWRMLALLGGLQLLGGHPETPLFTAVLGAVYLLARGTVTLTPRAERSWSLQVDWRVWGGFMAGWIAAAAISAAQTLPLALTVMESGKWLHWQPPTPIPAAVRGALLLRAILPHPFGSATAGSWWGPYNDPATAIYAGALTLPLAFSALPLLRRDPRWRAVGAMTLFAVLGAYHFPLVKQLLLALPLLRHGLHHYLKIGLELGLALLASAGWQAWQAGGAPIAAGARAATGELGIRGSRAALVLAASTHLLLIAIAAGVFLPEWREHSQVSAQLPWLLFAGGCATALAASSWLPAAGRSRLAWLAPALLLGELALAHRMVNPGVSSASLYPSTPAVRFLTAQLGRVAATGAVLRPDAAMVYGLADVRGDSPVKLESYQRLYARLAVADPVYFRPVTRWLDPLLDDLGVRWVMTGGDETPADPRWRLAFDGADADVWERPSALPIVRWEGPPRASRAGRQDEVRVLEQRPGAWRIAWRSDRRRRLLVAETWDAGWRARSAGRDLPIGKWNGALMAVDLPPGNGTLELRYLPSGFAGGALLSALAVAAMLAFSGTFSGGDARRWARGATPT
jgi:hypothetical protein